MQHRVSIRDIAEKIGTSHTTVSLALRNDPRILQSTRKKVEKAAADLGYRKDAVLSDLMTHLRTMTKRPSSSTLGFVTAWASREGWRKAANHARFFKGLKSRASDLGYAINEFWLYEPGMTPNRMTAILRARGIKGLILQSLPDPRGKLCLKWQHFACVTKGLTVETPDVHRVISSHYDDMQLAIRKLRQKGYRRFGLVLSESHDLRVGRAWLAAYLLQQYDLPPDSRVPALLLAHPDAKRFADWFVTHKPDVILFADEPVTEWLIEMRLKTPRDIGLVTLDWSPDDAPMAGIDSDPESLGTAAVDLLVGQLHAHEYGVPKHEKIVEVKGRWIAGATIR